MAISAESIIHKVRLILQDTTPGGMRHLDDELLGWLNAGQREVVLQKPEAGSVSAVIPLAGGTKQYLPDGGIQLLDVERNEGAADGTSPARAITITDRAILDSGNADWHGQAATDTVFHYTFDPNDPEHFYSYPPSDSLGVYNPSTRAVEGATRFARAAFSTSPAELAAITDNITIHDTWANALTDYILFRAYAKDSTYSGNHQRSMNHYTLFGNSVGIKLTTENLNDPNQGREAVST